MKSAPAILKIKKIIRAFPHFRWNIEVLKKYGDFLTFGNVH